MYIHAGASVGNKPKPNALKLLQGTDRPDRTRVEVDLPLARDLSAPDTLVSPEAIKTWKRLVGILEPVRMLSDGDLIALEQLCNLHGECVSLWRAGRGGPTAAQLTQLRLLLVEFGLTPASRSKAAPLPGDAKGNPWAEMASGR